jgi:hypothetical protein
VQEKQRPKPSKPPPAPRPVLSKDDELVDAMEGISTKSPEPQPEHIDPKPVPRGPRFTVKPITPEYIAQLASGIDLIFSDYAHQEEGRSKWLQERYRTVDGEEKCTLLKSRCSKSPNHDRRRPPHSHPRQHQHLHPKARSHTSPPPTRPPRPPIQSPRSRTQRLPRPPRALHLPSQIPPTHLLLRRQRRRSLILGPAHHIRRATPPQPLPDTRQSIPLAPSARPATIEMAPYTSRAHAVQ